MPIIMAARRFRFSPVTTRRSMPNSETTNVYTMVAAVMSSQNEEMSAQVARITRRKARPLSLVNRTRNPTRRSGMLVCESMPARKNEPSTMMLALVMNDLSASDMES